LQLREGIPVLSPGLVLAAAILAISWGSILVRLCSAEPLTIAFYRLGLAAALLFPFALRRGVLRSLPRSVSLPVLLSGLLLALHFGAWIWSLSLTSIGSSVVLVSTQPLFSALLSGPLLGERAPGRVYAGIIICLTGMLLISGEDLGVSTQRLLGDLLSMTAALAGAAYFALGRWVRRGIPFVPYLFLVYAAAAAILGVGAWAAGQSLSGLAPKDYLWLAAMAIFPSIVGHGCLNWAVRHLEVFYVSLAAFGEPVLATLYAWILFGEKIPAALFAGGGLIFTGLVVALPRGRKMSPGEG